MKVKIDIEKTLNNMDTEDELYEQSTTEAVYQIRALKACLALKDTVIDVKEITAHQQARIEQFDIYVFVTPVDD